jgi:hypothetical protein
MQITSLNNNISYQGIKNNKSDDKKIKAGVVAASVIGVGAALAHVAKRQGFSLSPSAIRKTPVKDWAIFGLYNKKQPERKVLELDNPLDIIEIASASVAGGLVGGVILDDKKHIKAKVKESVNQLLGNVLVPISCVAVASNIFNKHKERILNLVPQFAQKGKTSKFINKVLKALPASVATLGSLGVGIFAGNRVSNILNEKIFHKKVKREIKGSDFAPHVDDLGMAISLMSDKSKFSSFVQRLVPLFLCVPGIETGTHREE